MNNSELNVINNLKNIKIELSNINESMRKDDVSEINDFWNDKNADLFVDEINNVNLDIDKLISKINDTIKDVSKTSFNGGSNE